MTCFCCHWELWYPVHPRPHSIFYNSTLRNFISFHRRFFDPLGYLGALRPVTRGFLFPPRRRQPPTFQAAARRLCFLILLLPVGRRLSSLFRFRRPKHSVLFGRSPAVLWGLSSQQNSWVIHPDCTSSFCCEAANKRQANPPSHLPPIIISR